MQAKSQGNDSIRVFQIEFIIETGLAYEEVIVARQADGNDVGLEGHLLLQPHERQVVLVREEVVLGVHHLPRHLALDVRVRLAGRREVPLADAHADLRDLQASSREEEKSIV